MPDDAGRSGQPGQLGTTAALGGDGEGVLAGRGGNGGAGHTPAGLPGESQGNGGGGGGAAGRIRINSLAPAAVLGVVSPTAASGLFTTGTLLLVTP